MMHKIKQKVEITPYQRAIGLLQAGAWGAGALINLAGVIFVFFAYGQVDWFTLIMCVIFAALIFLSSDGSGDKMSSAAFSVGAWLFAFIFSVIYGLIYSPWFFAALALFAAALTYLLVRALKIKKETEVL